MPTGVLICDDSALARKQMAKALPSDWDVSITYASGGLEALEQLRAGVAEVLFLDLNMPDVDGYRVLQTIRDENLPIFTVIVSGDIQPQARTRVLALGAIDFIKKPTTSDNLAKLLRDYGLYRPGEKPERVQVDDTAGSIDLHDYLQETANLAMGRAADLLARLLNVFIKLPVPKVNKIARSELSMALSAATTTQDTYSAVCQGFTGSGIAGEALLLFADSSFADMAHLLNYEIDESTSTSMEVEVLMDMSSILFGAFLKCMSDQMGLQLALGHPTVLGKHLQTAHLVQHHQQNQEQLLAIEFHYTAEGYAVNCDLMVLFTEDSLPKLTELLRYSKE